MGQVFPEPGRGSDEIKAVGVVFLYAGTDGEDVRVEYDILGREVESLGQKRICTLTYAYLALVAAGLPVFRRRPLL